MWVEASVDDPMVVMRLGCGVACNSSWVYKGTHSPGYANVDHSERSTDLFLFVAGFDSAVTL